jgi:hypothetical protein
VGLWAQRCRRLQPVPADKEGGEEHRQRRCDKYCGPTNSMQQAAHARGAFGSIRRLGGALGFERRRLCRWNSRLRFNARRRRDYRGGRWGWDTLSVWRPLRHHVHQDDPLVAKMRQRANQLERLGIAQDAPELKDRLSNVAIAQIGLAPHPAHELIVPDGAVAMLNQVDQAVENFRRYRHRHELQRSSRVFALSSKLANRTGLSIFVTPCDETAPRRRSIFARGQP